MASGRIFFAQIICNYFQNSAVCLLRDWQKYENIIPIDIATTGEHSMDKLTKQQAEAADVLLQKRPPVIPGTRAIVDAKAQRTWFDEVTATMTAVGIERSQVNAFCDLAGVAD